MYIVFWGNDIPTPNDDWDIVSNLVWHSFSLIYWVNISLTIDYISFLLLLTQIITDYSGFKQLIILKFWKSEVWNGPQWAKIRVLVGLHSFVEVLGENLVFFSSFPAFRTAHISWLMHSYQLQSLPWLVEPLFNIICFPSPFKDLCDSVGFTISPA